MASNDAYSQQNGDQPGGDSSSSSSINNTANNLPQFMPNEGTQLKPGSKQAYFSDEKVLIPESTNVSKCVNMMKY